MKTVPSPPAPWPCGDLASGLPQTPATAAWTSSAMRLKTGSQLSVSG
jgi:hypothetical protein